MRSTSVRLVPILLSAALGTGQVMAALPPPEDRAAILAMQGEYVVRFHFQETVPLSPGYEARQAKDSGAREVVILVEDSPTKIVLQHLLVSPKGHVTKHWRQDWVYEAPERFEFVAEQTWRLRPLAPEETAGKWTQCVYEVSDAPRYCGTGAWNHKYGNPTWTSDRSWRPLPRREYTVRSDYNALNVENRHTITPFGWTHEQDNTKVRREGERTVGTLTREFGFNDYRRTTATDFGPAYRYWQATAPFWAEVRARWQAALASGGLVLDTSVDGMPVIEALFELAAKRENGDAVEAGAIDGVFARHVRPLVAAEATAQR
ncbi:MAG: hypothetical protein KatS3mg127_0265 [Silanimonas sp.]|nr:MAG: hypothetical protein KatS3mg127_0265 [Silanimonas sp.]